MNSLLEIGGIFRSSLNLKINLIWEFSKTNHFYRRSLVACLLIKSMESPFGLKEFVVGLDDQLHELLPKRKEKGE